MTADADEVRNGGQDSSMTTALITGPTSGIGAAFTRALAAKGLDLVLVSRDATRLGELAEDVHQRFGVSAEVLAADLADPVQRGLVEARLSDQRRPIGILVNNAGFGLNEAFTASSIEDEQRMLDVLVTATMRLTHAALPGMLDRGFGVVLNVSSVASWITSGTYAAAKAWVTVFSESMSRQLVGSGVRVTAVCPGYVRTEFHQRAGMDMSGIPDWMWLDADVVAAQALRDVAAHRPISVTGTQYRLLSAFLRQAPRWIVRMATGSPTRLDQLRTGRKMRTGK